MQFSGDNNTTGLEASYMRLDIAAIMEKVSVLCAFMATTLHFAPPRTPSPMQLSK